MATPRLVETKLIKTLFRCPKMSCKTRGRFDFDLNIILTRQQILLDKKGIWSTKFVERAKYHFWKKERRFLEQGASIPPNGDDCREGNVATEAACPRLTDWIYLPRLGAQTCNGGKKVNVLGQKTILQLFYDLPNFCPKWLFRCLLKIAQI